MDIQIKTGIPQFIEVGYLIYVVVREFGRHGKRILDDEFLEKIKDDKFFEGAKIVINIISALVAMFWVSIAYWGGCSGIWMYVYLFVTVGLLAWSANLSREKISVLKHNGWRTFLTQAVFQIILFMGGFYTVQ